MNLPRSLVIEFGRCGWGTAGDLVPELRLGWVRLWACGRGVADWLRELHHFRERIIGEAEKAAAITEEGDFR